MVLIVIGLGGLVWIDFVERKAETLFTSEGVEIRVLQAESERGVTKIVEPNGEISLFSDEVKKEELTKIAERQKTLLTQLDYSYNRIKRYVKRELSD